MFVLGNLLAAVANILHMILMGYMWVIIIRALISWVNPDPYNPIVRTLYAVTEPVLSRLRRKLPLFAGSIDFSPIVVILIIAVAAFNIVSSLVMVVTDKQADIAILRTLGAAPSSITSIFMIQGTLIGVVGTLLGLAGGIALALNVETVVPFIESLLGIKFLSKDVYYISELPSELQPSDVLITAVFSFVLSLAATIYPSWRAAKINPAEALRYE